MNNNELNTGEIISEIMNEEPVYRKPLNILKKRRATIALIIALSLVATAGLTFLAYKLLKPNIAPGNETFYFTSDLLSDKPGKEFAAYKTIDFKLCNYADELRSSKTNIDDFAFRLLYGNEDITAKCKIDCGSYQLNAGDRSSTDVSITVPDEYYGLPVNVSVESLPITSTLYGTFIVYGDWGYEIAENENEFVCKMTIWANTDIDLKISWDPQLVTPDYTNLLIFEYSIDDLLDSAEAEDRNGEGLVLKGQDNVITKNGISSKIIKLPAGTSTIIPMFKNVASDNYLRGNNKAGISVEEISTVSENASENDTKKENGNDNK